MGYGTRKTKIEGGSGGKRGHSNMNHWVTTQEFKAASRKARRLEARELERRGRMGAGVQPGTAQGV